MAVPLNVKFDRYAQLTGGLVQVSSVLPFIVNPTGVALVTGFLTAGIWSVCYDPIVTVWAACYSAVITTWTNCYSAIVTVWTNL